MRLYNEKVFAESLKFKITYPSKVCAATAALPKYYNTRLNRTLHTLNYIVYQSKKKTLRSHDLVQHHIACRRVSIICKIVKSP